MCACSKSSCTYVPFLPHGIIPVYVFLCALVIQITGVCLWSEQVWVYVCVHMHLFHIHDLMSVLEVCEYISVCSPVLCSAAGHLFHMSMCLLLPTSHEPSSSSPWGDSLELYYLVPHVWSETAFLTSRNSSTPRNIKPWSTRETESMIFPRP